ncbi:MAG: DUF1116 domain-containing protein [Anaerolineae bacterium]
MKPICIPTLDRALQSPPNGIDVKGVDRSSAALRAMKGTIATSGHKPFLRAIGPALACTNRDNEILAKVIEFIDRNDHWFLNLSMPAGKCAVEPAEGIGGSSIVIVMAVTAR